MPVNGNNVDRHRSIPVASDSFRGEREFTALALDLNPLTRHLPKVV